MALSSAILANAGYMTAAEDMRNLIKAAFPFGQGYSTPTDFALTPGSGLNMNYGPGYAVVEGSAAGSEGAYFVWDTVGSTIPWVAPDPTNPRIDALILFVCDSQYGTATASDGPQWYIVEGVAASSPSAPSDATIASTLPGPGGWYRVANVTLPANATAILAGNITTTSWPGGPCNQLVSTSANQTAGASTETAVMTFTIPRNSLRVGAAIVLEGSGHLTATFGTNTSWTAKLRLTNTSGSQISIGNGPGNPTSNFASSTGFVIRARMWCITTGSAGTVGGNVELLLGSFGNPLTMYASIGSSNGPITMDTTSDQIIVFTLTQGSTAGFGANMDTGFVYRAI